MKLIRVGTAVVNQIPLAWSRNLNNILSAIEEARRQGVTLLSFPELAIPGYCCEDAFYSLNTIERSWACLKEIVAASEGMIISIGLPTIYHNGLFNTACTIADGKILGLTAKRYLAGDGIYYEPRWFRAWPQGHVATIKVDGEEILIGDLSFDIGGVRIGYEICEDAWVADRPGAALSLGGVDIIINPSGSHFAFDKFEIRKRLVLEGSRAFGVVYLYSNLVGNEAGRMIFDGGGLIASAGKIIAQGERFSFKDWSVTSAVVDVEAARMVRTRTHSFKPSFDNEHPVTFAESDFVYPEIEPVEPRLEVAEWEHSAHIKEEEFTRAVALALFDYMRKSWSSGFVISLSGGADSAACTVLCALMVELALKDLGRERFIEKLSYVSGIEACSSVEAIVGRLVTTAYQATRHSGDVTRDAAQAVADAVGAEHHEISIDGLVQQYTGLAEGALGRALTWERDDVTLQNIQARVRGPSVWMLANVKNALLLATSNRSEASVGYTTMDGDTCGGLSPIAGIDKDFLRQWLRWMERHGPLGSQPIPALGHINAQQPTAELRPQDAAQTDEGDLMPYDLLDAIERVAIGDKLSPVDVFKRMKTRYPQYTEAQLHTWVTRFFKLFARNQWKRERFAPSFHLDDKNLDPKTWCRWPILSSGFKEELAELDALITSHE